MDPQPPATPPPPQHAWQPLTFGGVAGLAVAPTRRLAAVAALVALILGGLVLHYVHTAWIPAVGTAVRHLPPAGEIRSGRLVWPADGPVVLADSPRLAIRVDPTGTARDTQGADWIVAFGPTALRISSLLGMSEFPYPTAWIVALNQPEVEPRWGAWRPHLLAATAIVSALAFLSLWAVLAIVLSLPVKVYCILLDRQSDWRCCWRLAVAALLPGALIMGLGILCHTLGYLHPVELVLVFAIHLLVDLAYLLGAPWALPAAESAFTPIPTLPPASPRSAVKNPFAAPEPPGGSPGSDRDANRDGNNDQ